MNKKELEEKLREYRSQKAEYQVTIERIEQYKHALKNPELCCTYVKSYWSFGGVKTDSNISLVEKEVLSNKEIMKRLEEWIRHDKSVAFHLKSEIQPIETVLNNLGKEDRYIIELKYFDKMKWEDIEYSFNKAFRNNNNCITKAGLRNKNNCILDSMISILQPYYSRLIKIS